MNGDCADRGALFARRTRWLTWMAVVALASVVRVEMSVGDGATDSAVDASGDVASVDAGSADDGRRVLSAQAEFVDCLAGPDVLVVPDPVVVNVSVGPGVVFTPTNVAISTGDTVHWFWAGGFHNVESGVGGTHDGNFRSGNATSSTSTTFDVTFDAAFLAAHPMPGNVYPYYCVIHEGLGMVGSVTVNPPACAEFDADDDGDVDLRDFWMFQQSFTGN